MDSRNKIILAVGLGAAVVSGAAYTLFRGSSQGKEKSSKELVKEWKAVGRLTDLHIFPIKSCKGIKVEEADAHAMGLTNATLQDRTFLVINENNNFLHARIHPTMVLIEVSISGNNVELKAPNMDPITFPIPSQSGKRSTVRVRVWGEEVTATDCGDQVAMWLSQYIFQKDSGARLVHSPYTEVSPRLIKTKAALPWMRKSDGAVFTDLTPFHLLSTESVDDLNSRLDGVRVSALNFRPTMTVSGCDAYDEDSWRFVRIGENAVFRYVKGCDRCVLTTIVPETGVKHSEQEPLPTLRSYRLAKDPELRKVVGESPLFGINLALDQPGRIRLGDIVYVGQV